MQGLSLPLRFAPPPRLAGAPPTAAPAPAPADPANPAPPEESEEGTTWDHVSGVVGRVGHALAKLPGAVVRFIPGLLQFAVVDAIVPMVQFTAALGGVVAFVGVGASGIIEMVSGARHKDPVKVLSGAGELSRGLFLGTVAEAAVSRVPFDRGLIGSWGHGLSYATGAFAIAAGAMKWHIGDTKLHPHQRMEGILEVGIGICSLVATQGTLLYPAIAAQAGLAVARLVVTKREKLAALGKLTAQRVKQSWHNFGELIRKSWGHDKAEQAGPATQPSAPGPAVPPQPVPPAHPQPPTEDAA